MKNKGNSLIIISALVIVIITTTYLFIRQKFISIPKVDSIQNTQTREWKTYKNDLYGYQVQIPDTWTEIEHSSNFEYVTTFRAKDESWFEIMVNKNKYSSLNEYLEAFDQSNQANYEGLPSRKVLISRPQYIGSYLGIYREEEWLAAGFKVSAIYLSVGNKVFSFTAIPNEKSDTTNAQINYLKILTTFKLDNPIGVPTCKPRPACLDSVPACKIPETSDMCPPKSG